MNRQGDATSHKIFIIGTGRSGTHWLGYILQGHPDIHVTVEAVPVFSWATDMAIDPRTKPRLLPKLLARYVTEHAQVAPKHYADKSHPNIWHAEDLAARLPDAVFLGIQRNPYATVASMLKHDGVLKWHRQWRRFPVPNRFLGITADNAASYESLPLAAKCGLRWRAHAERMNELVGTLGNRLLVLSYERLIRQPAVELDRINAFLRLPVPVPMPDIKGESLDRWRQELSPEDRRQIASVTGIEPDCGPSCP